MPNDIRRTALLAAAEDVLAELAGIARRHARMAPDHAGEARHNRRAAALDEAIYLVREALDDPESDFNYQTPPRYMGGPDHG